MLRGQGTDYKFTTQGQPAGDRSRLFGSQVRKNVFWTLASGVTIWTAYEVATWWLYANELLAFTSLASNPVWFIALVLLVPMIRALCAGASTLAARPTRCRARDRSGCPARHVDRRAGAVKLSSIPDHPSLSQWISALAGMRVSAFVAMAIRTAQAGASPASSPPSSNPASPNGTASPNSCVHTAAFEALAAL